MGNIKSTFEEQIEKTGKLIYTNVGDSMMPLIKQGTDLVIIEKKPEGKLKKYDVPLYKRDSGQYVLHRIMKVKKGQYIICGDNRWHREYGIEDRHIIGVLTGIVRGERTISCKDLRYRLYCHLWCDFFYVRAFILMIRYCSKKIIRKMKRKKS